jgi:deoxyribodipyrimidine photo-lyase
MTHASTSPPDLPEPIHIPPDIDRPSLIALARDLTPHLRGDDADVSQTRGGRDEAAARLRQIDPIAYGRTRNHLDGAVTQLSPFVTQGVLSLSEVRDAVLNGVEDTKAAEKMVQQLAWRDYWQRLYISLGDGIWDDQEEYKTGFSPSDYADELPDDIAKATTGVAAIDQFLTELTQTGWLHNHARLYLASYICHFRRIKWQAGARFFLTHLLDGDPASNNLSWQWVASTFSHKPYYFNLENLQRFAGGEVDTSYNRNKPLAGSYEDLHLRLFPNLPPIVPQPRKAKR